MTTGLAVPVVSLFGFAYATDSHVPGADLLATTVFVDGTKDVLPPTEPYSPYRMKNSLRGTYAQPGPDVIFTDGTTLPAGDKNVFIDYPRSVGVLTGPTDPTYDQSEAIATRRIIAAVQQARTENPGQQVYVVGYSQGAGAASKALEQLEGQGYDTTGIQFVLAANPRRNDGGLLARLPQGVYVPLAGVSFGDGTSPQRTPVLQITKQYDGVADSPKYILIVAADLNAMLGFYYLHGDYYKNVDPNDPNAIVTYSADGLIKDELIPNPVGQLPLTRPLLDAGVPAELVSALDPFLRAVIETAYDRPTPGSSTYPSEPVNFQLTPPPDQWATDLQAITQGWAETAQTLAALGQPNLVVAADPLLRAVMETGYYQAVAGSYTSPTAPVQFQVVPAPSAVSPSQWSTSLQAITNGIAHSAGLPGTAVPPIQLDPLMVSTYTTALSSPSVNQSAVVTTESPVPLTAAPSSPNVSNESATTTQPAVADQPAANGSTTSSNDTQPVASGNDAQTPSPSSAATIQQPTTPPTLGTRPKPGTPSLPGTDSGRKPGKPSQTSASDGVRSPATNSTTQTEPSNTTSSSATTGSRTNSPSTASSTSESSSR